MSAERNQPFIDLAQDGPFDKWTYFVNVPIPEREFGPGKNIRWRYRMTPEGFYFFNMIHNDYSDALCQLQCFYDNRGVLHTFFERFSPTGNYIPKDLMKEAFFQVWGEIERRTPRSA